MLRRTFVAVLAMICGSLMGCSGSPHSDNPTAPATITITYGGEAVTGAQVDLNNDQTGLGAGGTLDSNGKVVLTEVPLGQYVVTVLPPEGNPLPSETGEPAPATEQRHNVPEKVRSPQTSPLKVEVKEGANDFTFDLKDSA